MKRIEREKHTITLMIGIYCRHHHTAEKHELCPGCRELLDYAHSRLDRCRHGNHKSSCRKCITHCYAPQPRARIREVMRYVGPRMIFLHPVAAIRHLLSELS